MLALQVARSQSVSMSSTQKRGHSASLDTPRQPTFSAPLEPLPCPQAGEDDTLMNSRSESLTGSQIAQVKQELTKDDSLQGLRSSIHFPPNHMSKDSPPPQGWPSAAHSRHATPAPDFTTLPPHFALATSLPPLTARIGGNNEYDGPAPSDRTPTAESNPQLAAAQHIATCVCHEIDMWLKPFDRQMVELVQLYQRLEDKVDLIATSPPNVTHLMPIPHPAPVSQAAPSMAAPTTARQLTQNTQSHTILVPPVLPAPRAPATHSQGVPETVQVLEHVPVTDTMLVALDPTPPTHIADAVEFPSLEETRLAIPSHHIKCNVENKAVWDRQWRQVPGATGPSHTPQTTKDAAWVDGDDSLIPLRSSHVCPLFASVATQKVVAQHLTATPRGWQDQIIVPGVHLLFFDRAPPPPPPPTFLFRYV
jgi:hypothetical protein